MTTFQNQIESPSVLLPRVLLTNDDGIGAPGLKLLEDIITPFAEEVWIVAPGSDQSGTGQNISLHKPIRCRKHGERKWAVDGTPGDCVALAITEFMKDAKPSLVLSGVNAGANLGDELNMSGTAGAALTALMLNVPSLALSQASPARNQTPWETSRAILPHVLSQLLKEGWPSDVCLCVNVPPIPPEEIKGMRWARQGKNNISGIIVEKRTNPLDEHHFWLGLDRRPPTPCDICDSAVLWRGEVAITTLSLDRSRDFDHEFIPFSNTSLTKHVDFNTSSCPRHNQPLCKVDCGLTND